MIRAALARLAGRLVGPETRAVADADFWGGAPLATSSSVPVTPHAAENLSTVLACVNAIGSAVGSLTPLVYRSAAGRREEAPNHPVARLLRRPNDFQTWPDFAEWLLAQALLRGNGLAEILLDGAGRPSALLPVPWGNASPVLLPSGRLAFDVVGWQGPFGGTGRSRRLMPGEFLHLKDRSDDGFVGRSRLARAREVVGTALGLQVYAGSVWANSATPSGVLHTEQRLQEGPLTRLRAMFDGKYVGPGNQAKVLILEQGLKWQAMAMSPEDAEVLASRRFTVEELCRLFQVPPPIVQDLSNGTFTNSREAGRWFAQFTLAPWVRKIEAEFARSVFADPAHSLEIDMSALLRGDAETRWASHKIAVEAGILDPDEVREIEGFNPRGQDAAAGGVA